MFQSNVANNVQLSSLSFAALYPKMYYASMQRNIMFPQFPQDKAIDMEVEEEKEERQLIEGVKVEEESVEIMEIDDEDANIGNLKTLGYKSMK